MVLYAITSLSEQGGSAAERRVALAAGAARWAAAGVDFVQLRQKRLDAGELLVLAQDLVRLSGQAGAGPRVLVNGRVDVALAAGAAGVHLPGTPGELRPQLVRRLWALAGRSVEPVVSVACHSLEDVRRAAADGASLVLFGPVFEKPGSRPGEVLVPGVGLAALQDAVGAAGGVPVLALGGVTEANAAVCVAAGAAGVAGIRLFG